LTSFFFSGVFFIDTAQYSTAWIALWIGVFGVLSYFAFLGGEIEWYVMGWLW
jgi:hypothetical protein